MVDASASGPAAGVPDGREGAATLSTLARLGRIARVQTWALRAPIDEPVRTSVLEALR